MPIEPLDGIVLGPRSPSGVLIWLHGLGADGHDFEPVVPLLRRPDLRVVLPHAPVRPVTINGGMRCRSWYDIRQLAPGPDRESAVDIRHSAEQVSRLVQAQRTEGIPAHRIALVGFSQGGAIALHVALRWPERLAAVVALSTYLVLENTLDAERADASTGMPAFFGHGSFDNVVHPTRGRQAADRLSPHLEVQWNRYPMDHAVCPDELTDLRAFLDRVLPAST
jgi:phospholipase/carboxylesterase